LSAGIVVENQAMLDALNSGEVLGFATQYPVLEGRIGLDQAVQALEHKPVEKFLSPIPEVITKDNISKFNMSLVLAPTDFKGEYSVKTQ
jgi:periplasmic protein TorT